MKQLIMDEKIIRKRMIDLNIKTINELAAKSGVSKPTIYEYMNGKTPLSSAFVRLCDYLEINPNDVLVESESQVEAEDV